MKIAITGAAAAVALSVSMAGAQSDYPDRSINMIIPYAPGGATDISARTIAEPLDNVVPESVVMTNRTGAGGATGSVAAKNADPDGYTMLFARVGSHTVNPAMKETLPYTLDDFDFVGVYEINPVACAVKEDSDIKTMDDLIAKVKEGGVSFSSAGVGSFLHIASPMVLKEFGVENPTEQVTHIPLRSGGEAATAVLNDTATFICTNTSALASFVKNDQLHPLLVTTAEPVEGFDAPTSADLGKPALEQVVGWTGVAGPAGLPEEVTAKWREWLKEATDNQKFRDQMEARGSVIRLMGPEESNEFIRDQYEVFRQLVDDLGMRIEG